jgi:cobalt-zinc-cadmium efflux system membrane fusion protein
MNRHPKHWLRLVILGVVLLVLIGAGVAAAPMVIDWLNSPSKKKDAADEDRPAAQLVRDREGRPGLRVSADVVKSLAIQTAPARALTEDRPLPAQLGQTAYDINRLYPVRSIANGKVTAIMNNAGETGASEHSLPDKPRDRPVGFGDVVKKGQLLAIVRSTDLAEKKGAYVDALLDLGVDRAKLAALERSWRKGAISEATYRDQVAKVQKDILTVERTRRILELTRLEPREIKFLEDQAETIKSRFRELAKTTSTDRVRLWKQEQVDQWARIEVRAPESGTLVEKNTNVGDITDPGKDPPMFRIADLKVLSVWINPPEEYLAVLQQLLREQSRREIRLELRLQSDPTAPARKGRLLRFAPSLDPQQKTPLLVGEVENSDKRLLIGQLLSATIFVPQEKDLVEIPTNALNDVHGQSLVFVESRDAQGAPVYVLRRVQVAHRFADVVQVRSVLQLSTEEKKRLEEESRQGKRPIEPLLPGERVVTGGVVEMTDALEDLKAQVPPRTDKDQGKPK